MEEKNEESLSQSTCININILRIRNLKSDVSSTVNFSIKMEFDQETLGESHLIKCQTDQIVDVCFQTQIIFDPCKYKSLDNIASKPILCTIMEAKNQDKKVKDTKMAPSVLAQCTIDLLRLLLGDTQVFICIPLHLVPGSRIENSLVGCPKPKLDIELSSVTNLDVNQNCGDIMKITLGSMFSLPTSWEENGINFNYIASFPIPIINEKFEHNLSVFTNGQFLCPKIDKEVQDLRKRWPLLATISTEAAFIQNNLYEQCNIDDECGDFRCVQHYDFRRISQTDKSRITWNVEKRCYLDKESLLEMRNKVVKCRYWVIEIFRVASAVSNKSKSKGDKADKVMTNEEVEISFHGIAYVDMSPLLYPGETRMCGAYRVTSFNKSDKKETENESKLTILEESLAIINNVPLQSNTSTDNQENKKNQLSDREDAKKNQKINKKGKGNAKVKNVPSEKKSLLDTKIDSDVAGEGNDANEPDPYAEACTFIVIDICLLKPLIQKRAKEEIADRVSEYIPPRPKFPKRTISADKVVCDYQAQINAIAKMLLNEFREHYGDLDKIVTNIGTEEIYEEKRQSFLYHLNSSGKYLAFKEQLKFCIVKIVREKYLRTTSFNDQQELQSFVTNLYVYLVDQMHVSLNNFLSIQEPLSVPCQVVTAEQLKIFAKEAEFNGNFTLASKYYLERIARDKVNPDYWFDNAVHEMLIGDLSKAEECFNNAVSLDQKHVDSLIMSAVVTYCLNRMEPAELLLQSATDIESTSIVAWTILGLMYAKEGRDIDSEMAFGKATKINKLENNATNNISSGNSINENNSLVPDPEMITRPYETIFILTSQYLLCNNEIIFSELALSHHLLDNHGGLTIDYYLAMARLNIYKKQFLESQNHLNTLLSCDLENLEGWSLLGHVHYLKNELDDAERSFERLLAYEKDTNDIVFVLIRLASIYMLKSKFEEARITYVKACKRSPTCLSWLGVAIACYRLCKMEDAEDALSEANILDNENAEVWAYLSLVSLQKRRKFEAEQAYKYSIRLNLNDCILLEEIKQLQSTLGYGNPEY